MHKRKVTTIRIPTIVIKKLRKLKKWEGEPWYSVINRLIKKNGENNEKAGR